MKNKKDAEKIAKAMHIALDAHGYTLDEKGENYFIAHCLQTFNILKEVTNDVELLCAGLLHDVIEDTPLTYDSIVQSMGKNIADLIMEVTKETKTDGSHFPRLHTEKGIILKFADRLSNLSRMQAWDAKKKQWYLNKSKFWKE
ncbi:MAG: HD domain-containing protein [Candidatus Pacearchaeota archaeon]